MQSQHWIDMKQTVRITIYCNFEYNINVFSSHYSLSIITNILLKNDAFSDFVAVLTAIFKIINDPISGYIILHLGIVCT